MTDSYADWKGWRSTDFGRFASEDSLYYAKELRASGIKNISGLRVGELGYGNGTFAGWITKAGASWVGREASLELQKRAIDAGFKVLAPDVEFSKACGQGQLDLIVAFDVLEHLEIDAIRSFLRDTKEALKPGGLLIARLPSGDSPFCGAIYHGDVTHRTLLGSSAVHQLAVEAGLVICQVRSPVLPIRGVGIVRGVRRMFVRFTQAIVFSFVRHVLMGNGRAVISPNMIVVIRKEDVAP